MNLCKIVDEPWVGQGLRSGLSSRCPGGGKEERNVVKIQGGAEKGRGSGRGSKDRRASEGKSASSGKLVVTLTPSFLSRGKSNKRAWKSEKSRRRGDVGHWTGWDMGVGRDASSPRIPMTTRLFSSPFVSLCSNTCRLNWSLHSREAERESRVL